MASNARNLANLLGAGQTKLSADKLGADVPPGTEDYSAVDSLGTGTTIGETAFVSGTNRLYIWNGSGWYNIALINTTPTWDSGGQPSGSYVLDADSPQDPTTITLAASDPEGIPISYSYVTSGSMDSMATISQDSSVFTITPKTVTEVGEGVELTGSITFRASDGINILPHVSSFTLSFIFEVENSRYTTLLATAVDTSSNSNITDSSTNNHTITVLGDANAGTFSPYRHGGYSTYFDGNGDFLSIPSHTDFRHDQGDWTIDGWFYLTSFSSPTSVLSLGTYSGIANFTLYTSSTGRIGYEAGNGTSWAALANHETADNTVSLNQWHHIAWVRSSGSLFIYLDGTRILNQASATFGVNTSGNLYIGNYFGQATLNVQPHYQSDLRIIKGTALYTDASFLLPTERPTAITNTKLLTCHLPYITDGSSNGHDITRNGDTSTKPFGPYENLEYSVADHAGSVYFDGTDDGLTVPAAAWDRDADYTVECWAYAIGGLTIALSRNRQAADGAVFSIGGSYRVFLGIGRDDVNTWDLTYTGSVDLRYQWHHLALTYDASEKRYKIYVDGVNVFNGTSAYHPGSLNTVFNIGCSDTMNSGTTSYSQGWIADHRITDSVVYTSNFTPAAAPLSTITGTTLHLKGTDASIIDKSQSDNLKLVGNTTGSTTQAKFSNTKSMYFDGAGDYIITTQQELGTEDFTIEGWHYLLTRANNRNGIFGNYSSYSAGSLGMFAGHSSATTTAYQVAYNGAAFPASVIQGGTIAYNQWVHFAVVRNSGTMNLYINGTSVDSISATASLNGVGNNFIVGAPGDNLADGMHGYLEDFRITKGLARYTANFTPPTAPLKG